MTRFALATLALLTLLALTPLADAAPSHVVVSSFRFRGPAGASDEYVELQNPTDAPVDLSGWKLQGCSSTGASPTERLAFPPGATLPPRRYLLIAGPGYAGATPADVAYASAIADGGGIQLVTSTLARVDAVGAPTAHMRCREGAGLALPTSGDAAFVRLSDTDDNVADFAGPTTGAPRSLATPVPPGAPASLAATTGGAGAVDLAWAAPVDDGGAPVAHYRVYRGVAPGALALVAETPATTLADEGLSGGATYYYAVAAVNAEGEGTWSAEAVGVAGAGEPALPTPEAASFALVAAGLVGLVAVGRRARA